MDSSTSPTNRSRERQMHTSGTANSISEQASNANGVYDNRDSCKRVSSFIRRDARHLSCSSSFTPSLPMPQQQPDGRAQMESGCFGESNLRDKFERPDGAREPPQGLGRRCPTPLAGKTERKRKRSGDRGDSERGTNRIPQAGHPREISLKTLNNGDNSRDRSIKSHKDEPSGRRCGLKHVSKVINLLDSSDEDEPSVRNEGRIGPGRNEVQDHEEHRVAIDHNRTSPQDSCSAGVAGSPEREHTLSMQPPDVTSSGADPANLASTWAAKEASWSRVNRAMMKTSSGVEHASSQKQGRVCNGDDVTAERAAHTGGKTLASDVIMNGVHTSAEEQTEISNKNQEGEQVEDSANASKPSSAPAECIDLTINDDSSVDTAPVDVDESPTAVDSSKQTAYGSDDPCEKVPGTTENMGTPIVFRSLGNHRKVMSAEFASPATATENLAFVGRNRCRNVDQQQGLLSTRSVHVTATTFEDKIAPDVEGSHRKQVEGMTDQREGTERISDAWKAQAEHSGGSDASVDSNGENESPTDDLQDSSSSLGNGAGELKDCTIPECRESASLSNSVRGTSDDSQQGNKLNRQESLDSASEEVAGTSSSRPEISTPKRVIGSTISVTSLSSSIDYSSSEDESDVSSMKSLEGNQEESATGTSNSYDSSDDERSLTLRRNSLTARSSYGNAARTVEMDHKIDSEDGYIPKTVDHVAKDSSKPGNQTENADLSTLDNQISLSDFFDAEKCRILYSNGITLPSQLLSCNSSSLTAEAAKLSRIFGNWQRNIGLKGLLGFKMRRSSLSVTDTVGNADRQTKNKAPTTGTPSTGENVKKMDSMKVYLETEFLDEIEDAARQFLKSEQLTSPKDLLAVNVSVLSEKYNIWREKSKLGRMQDNFAATSVCRWKKAASKYLESTPSHEPEGREATAVSVSVLLSRSRRSRSASSLLKELGRTEETVTDQVGDSQASCGPPAKRRKKHKHTSHHQFTIMNEVSDISRTTMDSNGLPTRHFTVYNAHDETLYDFRIDVRTSSIPNSGFGAFLTFVGGRVPTPEAQKTSFNILTTLVAHVDDTMVPLQAVTPDGMGVSVSLAGDDLHENGGRLYVSRTRCPLHAILPCRQGEVRVKLNGNIHGEADQMLASNSMKQKKGIGFLGLHMESDYVTDEDVTFCSYSDGCGLIDLGRYGPFLKADRKTEPEFMFKDFIFDYEPAAWNFGVDEMLRGHKQIIDVTDDRTGEPHISARENIPMYVNEVGHNRDLKQNVLARERDDRVVHYFLHLKKPLKKGESVELLVDYLGAYEATRERKGYGKANIENGIKGDHDEKSRIHRNLKERTLLEKEISLMKGEELAATLKFLQSRILGPVSSWTSWYTDKMKQWIREMPASAKDTAFHPPPPRQWLARRRMYWLHERFQMRVRSILSSGHVFSPESLEEINSILDQMKCDINVESLQFIQHIKTHRGEVLVCSLLGEISEELLHLASNDLANPYDTSLWCPVASQLTKQVVKVMAASSLCQDPIHVWQKKLLVKILDQASASAAEIRRHCKAIGQNKSMECSEALRMLSFQPSGDVSSYKPYLICQSKSVSLDSPSFLCANHGANIPHGAAAPFANFQAYQETMESGGMTVSLDLETSKLKHSEASVVSVCQFTQAGADAVSKKNENDQINSLPQGNKLSRKGFTIVDEKWYLLRQVVYVVHSLAVNCIQWEISKNAMDESTYEVNKMYSLQKLCDAVGVSVADARAMLQEKKTKLEKRQSAPAHGRPPKTSSKFFHGIIWKALEGLGWKIEYGNRPNDRYYCPPGVTRCHPFVNRKDFFDSAAQVMNCAEKNCKWNGRKEVKVAVKLYYACVVFVSKLKAEKRYPKGASVEWVVNRVKSIQDSL